MQIGPPAIAAFEGQQIRPRSACHDIACTAVSSNAAELQALHFRAQTVFFHAGSNQPHLSTTRQVAASHLVHVSLRSAVFSHTVW